MPINVNELEKRLLEIEGKVRPASSEQSGFRFWKPKETHVVRIVPHTPQFVELMFHYDISDDNIPILCPASFNKPCPVDKLRMKLYKNGTPEDIALAKKLKGPWRFFAPIIVREKNKPDSEVVPTWWTFSKTTYQSIIQLCKNPEYGDISDTINGTDLDVVFTPAVPPQLYPKTSIAPKRKSSPLVADEVQAKRIIEAVPDMMKEVKQLTYEEIEKVLENWVSATSAQVDDQPAAGGSVDDIFKELNDE